MRYWLTVEDPAPLVFQVGSALGNGNVRVQYVPISPVRQGVTGYLEFSFGAGAGSPGGDEQLGRHLQTSARKDNYSSFFQGDDYSYVLNRDFASNARITAYRNGQLIFGAEPGVNVRIGAEEPQPLQVRVVGNPVVGSDMTVEVRGAGGQPLTLQLTDLTGRLVSERQVGQAAEVERQSMPLHQQPAGMFLLQVRTPAQSATLRVVKP